MIKYNGKEYPLYKRGKTYHYRFMVRGENYTGSTKKTTIVDAVQYYKEEVKHIHERANNQSEVQDIFDKVQKNLVSAQTIFFTEAWEEFKSFLVDTGDSSKKRYKRFWDDYVAYCVEVLKLKSLNEVTYKNAIKYIAYLKTYGVYNQFKKTQKPFKLSNNYINSIIKLIKHVFRALTKDTINKNPWSEVKILKTIDSKREPFTPAEINIIFTEAQKEKKKPYLLDFFTMAYFTGQRKIDICNFKWENVNFEEKTIEFNNSKTGKFVSIPLFPKFLHYLLLKFQKSNATSKDYINPDLHRLYYSGKNKDGSILSGDIRRFFERINIETSVEVSGISRKANKKGGHSFRHTFAWLMVNNGVPEVHLRDMMGHTKDSSITKYYTNHSNRLDRMKAFKLVEKNFNPYELDKSQNQNTLNEILELLNNATEKNWFEVIQKTIKYLKG